MCLALFLAASYLMVWRLENLAENGFEGAILGTLITPYCTGFGNLVFTYLIARKGGPSEAVVTNCLVNNITNMTLVLGVPAMIWNLSVRQAAGSVARKPPLEAERLSLLLTLLAVLFFTAVTWAVGAGGRIDFAGGLVLVALFLAWQVLHMVGVLRENARRNRAFTRKLPIDLLLLGLGSAAVYYSTNWLVDWLSQIQNGILSERYLGWVTGWLMVLPNATLAVFYGITRRPAVLYTSQVGDSHVCIPLCLGLYALWHPVTSGGLFSAGLLLLLGATLVHFACIAILGRLPRLVGALLVLSYAGFLYFGLLH